MAERRQALRLPAARAGTGWLALLLLPVLAVLLAMGYGVGTILTERAPAAATVSGASLRIGAPAPVFSAPLLGGGSYRLAAHRGRTVVVTFWATWCTACRDELPSLQSLIHAHPGVEAVAVDYRETDAGQMTAFLRGLGVSIPAAADPTGAVARAYGVDVGLPVTVVVDRWGRVAHLHIGQVDPAALAAELN